MCYPETGTVIKGTNGMRKARFVPEGAGKGKSGGYRIYYVYFADYGVVTLWAAIAKARQADLKKSDLNFLGTQVARLKALLDKGVIR